MSKVWDMESPDDVVRFVLRRREWDVLIEALAASCSRNQKAWDGLDVLRSAEIDIDASRMVKALEEIRDYSKKKGGHFEQIVNSIAESGLRQEVEATND